jgi:hypothetical protein
MMIGEVTGKAVELSSSGLICLEGVKAVTNILTVAGFWAEIL